MWGFLLALALSTPAEIAYVSDAGGIFSAKADGSAAALLVENGSDPAWSPDGTQLAYVLAGENDGHIMLGTRRLTPERAGITDTQPTWSADGTKLVFTRIRLTDTTYTTGIVTVDVATGAERTLITQKWTDPLATVAAPVFTRDGASVAYTYTRYDTDVLPEIRVIPASGGRAKTFIRKAQRLTYSPDGTKIAYASIKDHNGMRCGDSDYCTWAGELYVANADGSHATRLTRDKGDLDRPEWSPDGSRILFSSDRNVPRGNSNEVYSIGADGSCLTWLTNGTPESVSPVWRPNSGDTFTANCDPNARPATYQEPDLLDNYGGLWLGLRIDGLVLSASGGAALYYEDCERFSGCPQAVTLYAEDACGIEFTREFRFSVRRGWLVARDPRAYPLVFGGRSVTRAPADRIKDLKDRRKEKPRIPRAALNRLSAREKAKLRPYRVC